MGWACIWPSGIHSKERRSKIRRSPDCQQARRKRRAALRTANSPDGSGEPRSGLPTVQTEAESRAPDCRQSRRNKIAPRRFADEPGEERSPLFLSHPARREQDFHYSSFIRTDGKPESAILAVPELSAKKNAPFLQFPDCRERRIALFLVADEPDGRRIVRFLTKLIPDSLGNSHFILTFAAVLSGKCSQGKEPHYVHSIYRNYSFSKIGKILIVVE